MFVLLGNMLFAKPLPVKEMPLFMAEDGGLCTRFKYHKHKLIMILAAMRHYRDRLRSQGLTVEYSELTPETLTLTYEDKLRQAIQKYAVTELHTYIIEDHFFRDRLQSFCKEQNLNLIQWETSLFLTTHTQFQDYRKKYKRLFMADFYKIQRKRLNLLLDDNEQPQGGKWSFDAENREALPDELSLPGIPCPTPTQHVKTVGQIVDDLFIDHPGRSDEFWLPVTREDALQWLERFLKERFYHFGTYEDALCDRDPFVFHSVLSPLLNIGLLTPQEVLEVALNYAEKHPVPLNSLEGFIRQIIGWREYIRGVYHSIGVEQMQMNALNHTRRLTQDWYRGTTGLLPLDNVIRTVQKRGYAHHIERLMVVSNAMLLAEIHPQEVYRWFMEFFVDSAEWVMGPNIFGMGQFADGGLMMTKPYMSGSNYLRKMGKYQKGDWCEVWDGLYWRFVDRQRTLLSRNPRLAMMVKTFDKMNSDRREKILGLAEQFIHSKTA
jgi:deoxyribodipyrimidine photolyase-related protein